MKVSKALWINGLILGLGQEIHKMNLENLAVPESKEVLKKKSITMGLCSKKQEPSERAPKGQRWNNLSNKIK